jgi:quercetin dioxygenase-like cupin family protein
MMADVAPANWRNTVSFLDINTLEPWERLPGWVGRTYHSEFMTFSHWTFAAGTDVHEHSHPNEEVWHVLQGELEVTVSGESRRTGPGGVAIVPMGARHSVRALTDGTALVVDHPIRDDGPRDR